MSDLVFKTISKVTEINDMVGNQKEVFSAEPLVIWNQESVENELDEGWNLYTVLFNKDMVAGLFVKKQADKLITKNTHLNIQYQGNAFSHRIKEFYEELAENENCSSVVNLCGGDHFRTIALNESHGYILEKKDQSEGHEIQTWSKKI